MEVGSEIGAIFSANGKEVRFLGYGKYLGEQVPSKEENELFNEHKIKNPKIELENGSIVWGYECWWGPKEKIQQMIGDRKIINVNVQDKII